MNIGNFQEFILGVGRWACKTTGRWHSPLGLIWKCWSPWQYLKKLMKRVSFRNFLSCFSIHGGKLMTYSIGSGLPSATGKSILHLCHLLHCSICLLIFAQPALPLLLGYKLLKYLDHILGPLWSSFHLISSLDHSKVICAMNWKYIFLYFSCSYGHILTCLHIYT